MTNIRLYTPTICSTGYALFLAVNATAVWGGVFPFLPLVIQTPAFVSSFYLSQSLAFGLAFFLSSFSIYILPRLSQRFLIWDTGAPYFLGWICLITSIYLRDYAQSLAILGGLLIGVGSAGFYMAWQRLFSAQKTQEGNRGIIMGTLMAPVFYFALYLIPVAVTVYLIPFVFMPLFALSVLITSREIDKNQPMFLDTPRTRPATYKQALKDYWRGSLCIGSFALACGIMRAIAIETPQMGTIVNIIAMVSMFIAAALFLITWEKQVFKLNILNAYRLLFPFVISAFVIMPFFGKNYLIYLSAILYALYNCAIILMMAQCAQASRDRGVNPVFIYGFMGGIVYLLHAAGYLLGAVAENSAFMNLNPSQTLAIFAIYLLALMHFVGQGGFKQAMSPNMTSVDPIELIPTGGTPATRYRPSASAEPGMEQVVYQDRISKQCSILKRHYKLSDREAEIIELVARGNTITRIADELNISINTVKSHTKHIYTKLDIHKKQEMLDILNSFELNTFKENDTD